MGRLYSERVGCVSLVGHEAQSSLIWRVVSHRRTRDGPRAIYATSTVHCERADVITGDARLRPQKRKRRRRCRGAQVAGTVEGRAARGVDRVVERTELVHFSTG